MRNPLISDVPTCDLSLRKFSERLKSVVGEKEENQSQSELFQYSQRRRPELSIKFVLLKREFEDASFPLSFTVSLHLRFQHFVSRTSES